MIKGLCQALNNRRRYKIWPTAVARMRSSKAGIGYFLTSVTSTSKWISRCSTSLNIYPRSLQMVKTILFSRSIWPQDFITSLYTIQESRGPFVKRYLWSRTKWILYPSRSSRWRRLQERSRASSSQVQCRWLNCWNKLLVMISNLKTSN